MSNLMNIGIVLSAVDRITAPLRSATGAVGRLGTMAKGTSGALGLLSRNMDQIAKAGKTIRNIGGGMMLAGGGAAAGLGLTAVPGEAIRAEHALRALGNVGNLTNAQIANLQTSLVKTTRETNQELSELIQGTGTLVAAGLDPRIATRFMGVIGKTATATQSSVDDIAKTTFAVYDNLKVPEAQLMKTIDALAMSGKQGRFELANMARFFPMLTAGAQSLGMKGVPAVASLGAALQIAMKGAGSPEEAANNLQNFLQKITSKETVANFAKFGVNVESEMKLAAAKGIDPIEHMMGVIQKLTGGNKFKLAQIFSDIQVANFLAPMMKNMAEYTAIRDKSLNASGVVDKDLQAMMTTTLERWKQLKNTLAGIVMPALAGPLSGINRILKLVSSNATLAKATVWGIGAAIVGGGLLAGLGTAMTLLPKVRSGLVLVNAAMGLVKNSALGMRALEIMNSGAPLKALAFHAQSAAAGIRTATAAARAWSVAQASALRANVPSIAGLRTLSAGFGGRLLSGLRIGMTALRAFSLTLLTTPIGWIGLAVGAAALLIYKYWKPISGFFKGLWSGLKAGLKGLEPAWNEFKQYALVFKPFMEPLFALGRLFKALIGPVNDTGKAAEGMGVKFGKAIGGILSYVLTLPGRMLKAGMNIITSLTDGMLKMIDKPVKVIDGLTKKIRGFLPFSPAKEGAFRDIHRVKIVETIAAAMKPAPMVRAMRGVTAAAMLAAVPVGGAAAIAHPGAQKAASSGITFAPVINITAPGGNPEAIRSQVNEGMKMALAEFERMSRRMEADRSRRAF